MKGKIFVNLVKDAHKARADKIGLRPDQLNSLFEAAHSRFSTHKTTQRIKFWANAISAAALSAAAGLMIMFAYRHGANRAEMTAQTEIARLQTELEKTRGIRAEFAQLVKRYGREKVARMAHSNIDYETAMLIAEENYVQNIGNFRAELLAAIKREESGMGEELYQNRRL